MALNDYTNHVNNQLWAELMPLTPWQVNDMARTARTAQAARGELRSRGNAAKADKPRKKFGPLMNIFIRGKAVRFK